MGAKTRTRLARRRIASEARVRFSTGAAQSSLNARGWASGHWAADEAESRRGRRVRRGKGRGTFHIGTRPGTRTSLFAPALDRLFVAARAGSGEGAALLVYRPAP
jgi:hypothetical protein